MKVLAVLALAACQDDVTDVAWMKKLDDGTLLAALSIPGTHDSGAMIEPYPGLSKCQDLSIAKQLDLGVRYLDLRFRHYQDHFSIYHGAIDQEQTAEELLATLGTFLDLHPSETIIASVKEEAVPSDNTRSFEATFRSYLDEHWYLGDTIPTLGEARGKLVLLRRFDATMTPLGIDAAPWADNASFSISNAASLRIQDEYVVERNDAKWSAITAQLDAAIAGDPNTLFLDYTSGYQTIDALPNIPSVSDDINVRLDDKLATIAAPARLGVLVMDHVAGERVQVVVDMNALLQ